MTNDQNKPSVGSQIGKTAAESAIKGAFAPTGVLGGFKKGGTVPETGPYQLHEGEEVLPKDRASEYRKLFEQRGKEGKHKWGK